MLESIDKRIGSLNTAAALFERDANWWAVALFIATGILAFGIVLELWSDLLEVNAERKKGNKLKFRTKLMFAGSIIVALAVAMEGITEWEAFDSETKSRDMSDQAGELLWKEVSKDTAAIGTQRQQLAVMGATLATALASKQNVPVRVVISHPAPPIIGSVPPSQAGARHVDAEAARIILSTTRPGAVVSIIPFLPGEPETFARELGSAFAAVPGAQAAVSGGNTIENGQTGLIVQYDHSNPVSQSVFNALRKAGFHPTAGAETPGSPVVFIKVAPQE